MNSKSLIAAPRAEPDWALLRVFLEVAHCGSLSRAAAYAHLHRLATAEKFSIETQAERVLEAVEQLATPARV